MSKGFTLIEVLIAVFVLGIVVVGVFGFITLTLKATHDGQRRIVATALANEKMEMIRNLSYDNVGTVGGVPSGAIPQIEEVVSNNSTYTVSTDIRYIDDPFDGTATSGTPDTINTDYKQARVEVSWESDVSSRPVLLVTQIAPAGLEGGSSLGTLVFNALNAAGQAVAGATVRLTNSTVSPTVDLTTSTDDQGTVTIPGLIGSIGTYEISVTKDGYTSEQTYDSSSTFNPDVDHSHLSAVDGTITNKTFFIDTVSALTINTKNDTGIAIGDVPFTISGTKKTGTDDQGEIVYVFNHQDSTDSAGTFRYDDMVWDTYSFSMDGNVSGYDIKETSLSLPIAMAPGTDNTLDVTLVPHELYTLHVTVLTAGGVPIQDADVHVTGNGYDQTLPTSIYGQAFFTPIAETGDYTVTVDHSGYTQAEQQVTVDGGTRITVTLN